MSGAAIIEEPVALTNRTSAVPNQAPQRRVSVTATPITRKRRPSVRATAILQVGLKDGRKAVGTVFTFSGLSDLGEHVALSFGDITARDMGHAPLVEAHAECLSGETLGSLHCDCGARLQDRMQRVCDFGGLLLYLRHEGRGIGRFGELLLCSRRAAGPLAYTAQPSGHADRNLNCTAAAEMLTALGLSKIRMLPCDTDTARRLARRGIVVDEAERDAATPPRPESNGPAGGSPVAEGIITPREYDVLRRVARGQSNPEIAADLFISRNTVKSYMQNVLQKLNARNRVEAIAKARELGIAL